MGYLEAFLQSLASITPGLALQVVLPAVAFVLSIVVLWSGLVALASTAWQSEYDPGTTLFIGAVTGAASGLLWLFFNPIMIVPPFIHLRLFAFLPPLVGLIFGWRAGFICGYVATWVWAWFSGGAFIWLHTPFADGIMVGLTGVLPALILRGSLTTPQLLEKVEREGWVGKALLVSFVTGIFMSVPVAISLQLTSPVPFWVAFWAIGILSDTIPIMLGVAFLTPLFLRATRSQTWATQS